MAETQALAQREEKSAAAPIVAELAAVKPYLERLLGDNAARFGVTLLSLARRNPDLLRCDATTVVGAALVCAQLELEPGPAEHVWLIPRWNKNTKTNDCTLMLGKNGMKALAERHPSISSVRSGTVFEGDEFEYIAQPPSLRHVRRFASDKPVRWYAVAYRTDADAPHIAVLDAAAVAERRKHSASPDRGPWVTHFNQMAEKSAIRALWKELPSSLDMTRAASIDDSSGVARARDLLIGQPKLIDKHTGEVLGAEVGGPSSNDGATTDEEQMVASASNLSAPEQATSARGPQDVQRSQSSSESEPQATGPEPSWEEARTGAPQTAPASSAAPGGDPGEAAPERRCTEDQFAMLVLIVAEFGWDENTAFVRYGIDSWNDAALTFSHATKLLEIWIPKLESWRLNRRSRLADAARTRGVDLAHLLQNRGLPLAGELSAAQCQSLIEEIEAIEQLPANQPSTEEVASAPAADSIEPSAELRATFDGLMRVAFAGNIARTRWIDTLLTKLNLPSVDKMSNEQMQAATSELRKLASK